MLQWSEIQSVKKDWTINEINFEVIQLVYIMHRDVPKVLTSCFEAAKKSSLDISPSIGSGNTGKYMLHS